MATRTLVSRTGKVQHAEPKPRTAHDMLDGTMCNRLGDARGQVTWYYRQDGTVTCKACLKALAAWDAALEAAHAEALALNETFDVLPHVGDSVRMADTGRDLGTVTMANLLTGQVASELDGVTFVRHVRDLHVYETESTAAMFDRVTDRRQLEEMAYEEYVSRELIRAQSLPTTAQLAFARETLPRWPARALALRAYAPRPSAAADIHRLYDAAWGTLPYRADYGTTEMGPLAIESDQRGRLRDMRKQLTVGEVSELPVPALLAVHGFRLVDPADPTVWMLDAPSWSQAGRARVRVTLPDVSAESEALRPAQGAVEAFIRRPAGWYLAGLATGVVTEREGAYLGLAAVDLGFWMVG